MKNLMQKSHPTGELLSCEGRVWTGKKIVESLEERGGNVHGERKEKERGERQERDRRK
jgi:hypothetical protein